MMMPLSLRPEKLQVKKSERAMTICLPPHLA
jgi:hypothetical protein